MTKQGSPKKITLSDTGERMIPEHHKGNIIYGEHIIRYHAAAEIVKGKKVLDIASGSGYGSLVLAGSAEKVVGVEVDALSVEYAKKHYIRSNLTFMVGDGVDIPLEDDTMDAVVTFETIEHIRDYRKFLQEVKRVLKPNGILIISTPNDKEFAEGNHFHYHEFTHRELKTLLKKYFKHSDWYYQNTWLYSALLSAEDIKTETTAPITTINASPVKEEQSLYFFAVCSNNPLRKKNTQLGAISQVWSAKAAQQENDKRLLTDQHVKNLTATIDSLQKEIHEIKSSRTWAVAAKMSRIKNRARGVR